MERVHFLEQSHFHEQAEKTFLERKEKILRLLPEADVQHVGSTAIPNSLTKVVQRSDGTGFGDDGAIWGSELFVGSAAEGLERCGHLRYAVLPGGDAFSALDRRSLSRSCQLYQKRFHIIRMKLPVQKYGEVLPYI